MPGRLAAARDVLVVRVDICRKRYKNIYKQETPASFQRSLFLFPSAPIRIRYVVGRREATIRKKLIHHSTLRCRSAFEHHFPMIKPSLELPLRKPSRSIHFFLQMEDYITPILLNIFKNYY